MKKLLSMTVLALSFTGLVSCNKEAKLGTEEEKTLYAMGNMLGSNLQRLNLSESEVKAVAQGLVDASLKKEPKVNLADYQMKIQGLFKDRMEKAAVKAKEEGLKFLDAFVAKEGAQKTASGLAYKIVQEGTGATPAETDQVEVHYHGTLTDGTVFDSTKERGQSVTLELGRVIRGWKEGLQLMKEGSKAKFVIPADLAYGDMGAPPKIPGGATIVFDVELIKIVKAAPAAAPAPAAKKKK